MSKGREHGVRILFLALTLDALCLVSTFFLVMWARATTRYWWVFDLFPGEEKILGSFPPAEHLPLLAPILPLWLLALWALRVWSDPRILRPNRLVLRIIAASAGAFLLFLGLLWSVQQGGTYSRTFLVGFTVATIPALLLSHYSLAWYLRHSSLGELDIRRVLLLGEVEDVRRFVQVLGQNPDLAMRVVGILLPSSREIELRDNADQIEAITHVPVLGTLLQLKVNLHDYNIHHVFMFGRTWSTETLRTVADVCEEVGVGFSMDANFLGLKYGRAGLTDYGGWGMLTFHMTPSDPNALFVKRAMDIVLSALALIVLAPLLLLTAIVIKLEDGGPVLFVQERSGLYGAPFKVLKYRSMVIDAEKRLQDLKAMNEVDGPVFKIRRDPRITRIGSFIRKTSIDEFPQFFNVLMGEMSLVGPRPPIPAEVEKYERWQRRRLSMRPGLTCIWQVTGRNSIDFDTWMKLDLQYIDNWSLLLDIKLLFKTVPAMLFGTGH